MVEKGTYSTVEADETDLGKLLETVRQQRRPIRILSHGQPVADISPVLVSRIGPPDPHLRAKMLVPGHELTNEQDWSQE